MTCDYQDLESASDWSCRERNLVQPIKSTTKIWVVNVISMEFFQSFLKHHFPKKPVRASWNVSFFSQTILNAARPTLCPSLKGVLTKVWCTTKRMGSAKDRRSIMGRNTQFWENFHFLIATSNCFSCTACTSTKGGALISSQWTKFTRSYHL